MSVGVLVGCDEKQEWLLSWWYTHFRKHNPLCELAFADFGMTEKGRSWCQERGHIIDIPTIEPGTKENFFYRGDQWETVLGEKPWPPLMNRLVWLQKPAAMRSAPFHRVLWIDLDCKIRQNLDPLLSFRLQSAKIAARPYPPFKVRNLSKGIEIRVKGYNSGVMLLEKDSPLLDLWIEGSKNGAIHSFNGDDHLLSFYIALNSFHIVPLPFKYNWKRTSWGENPEAVIDHWEHEAGKIAIRLFEMNA